MKRSKVMFASVGLALALGACSSGQTEGGSGGSGTGSGGSSSGGSGGSSGSTGGTIGTGGNIASGGASGEGGVTGNGGSGPTGGHGGSGTGGGSSGGTTGTGGTGSGGSPAGGAAGTGTGGTGTGGTGTGGTTPPALPSLVVSGPGAYWNTSATLTTVTSGTVDITVNDTTTYQRFDGFGGAFNEQGWANIQMLSASDQMKAITLLFDATNGAHFMYGRIPIGSSDYAMSRYTDDETANDFTMQHFSITRDEQYLIPFVKAAMAVNPSLHLWASPWTPPTWMKTSSGSVNGTSCAMMDNNTFDGGCMTAGTNNQNLSALASYFVDWVQAYTNQENIPIEALHPQNEPNYSTPYSSCLWPASLYDNFIANYLGPAFTNSKLSTQIWLGTMSNNNSGTDPAIISAVTADKTAMQYIKGAGLQWNVMNSTASLAALGLTVMQTEHKCGNYPFTVSGENPPAEATNPNMAPNDQGYAMESWGLIRDWLKAGVNSYSAWNMVLDTLGAGAASSRSPPWYQNALLTVNHSSATLTVTPAYYVFRHISQYVQPGATRVGTTGTSLDALAFKNPDGSIVTIMYNTGTSAKTAILSVGGTKLQFSIPGTGWATVLH